MGCILRYAKLVQHLKINRCNPSQQEAKRDAEHDLTKSNKESTFFHSEKMDHSTSGQFSSLNRAVWLLVCFQLMNLFTFWVRASKWVSAAAAKSLQSCPTLCDPIDGNPPGSPVPGILQARTLEWGAISFSNAWKWKVRVKSFSHVWLLATPWTAAHQAPPSMGFSRQEYWSGLPLPSPLEEFTVVFLWYSRGDLYTRYCLCVVKS